MLRYDAAGQLLAIEERPAIGAAFAVRSYHYDSAGRIDKRLTWPQGSAWDEPAWTAVYDDDNRLTKLAGVTLNYDADGNLKSSRLPDGPWGASGAIGTFTWNARNQLTRVVRSDNPSQHVDYTYDAEGNLISQTDSAAGTTRWIIDPHGGPRSRVLAKVAPNGDVTRYVYGVGLLYEVHQDGTVRYYLYDNLGSTIALTNAAGAVVGRADYTPYGALQGPSGALATANATPFLFVGRHGVITDAATGLHHMRARWYSCHIRRFMSADPAGFGGGENFYAYANGNPVSAIDPSGFGAQNGTFTDGLTSLLLTRNNGIGFPGAVNGGHTLTSKTAAIDYDGSPNCYAPPGSGLIGLDYIGNAMHTGTHDISENVIPFARGRPIINSQGYYVSMTSYHNGPRSVQENNINGSIYAYITLGNGQKPSNTNLDDYVLIANKKNGRSVWAIYAESRGDNNEGFEMSPAAAREIGITFTNYVSDHDWGVRNRHHGVTSKQNLSITIFPGSGYGIFPGR